MGAVMLFIDSCEFMCNKYPQFIMFPEIMFSLTNLDILIGVCLHGLDNIMMYRRFIKSIVQHDNPDPISQQITNCE